MSTTRSGLSLAVGTFTRIPSGAVTITPATARAALLLAPVAVLPLAVLTGLVGASVELGVPPLVAGGLALAVLAHGSRGMHLDGLADVVDGLGAGWDRERALTIMRRGDVGPMGAAALILVLLVQAAAIAQLLTAGWRGALLLTTAVMASRASCAALCRAGLVPAPGSMMGAGFVGTVARGLAALLVTVLAAVLALAALPQAAALAPAGSWPFLRVVLMAVAAVASGTWGAIALRTKVVATIGGVNGDLLGAGIEIALTVSLVVLTLAW